MHHLNHVLIIVARCTFRCAGPGVSAAPEIGISATSGTIPVV